MVREDARYLLKQLEIQKRRAIKVKGASGKEYLMTPEVKRLIDIKLAHMKQNDDFLRVKVGDERSGKTILGDQEGDYIAAQTHTKFNINNIHFSYKPYMKFAQNCPKYSYVRHDEARHDLNKFRRLSTSNVIFNNYLSECGEDNINHDVILPRFCDLDPSVSIDRVKLIYKIYKFPDPDNPEKIIRGLYSVWSTKDKDLLLEASRNSSNQFPSKMFYCWGYFDYVEIIPNEEYLKKKKENRKKKYEDIEAGGNLPMLQRDILFTILNKDPKIVELLKHKIEKKNKVLNLSTREISELMKQYGQELSYAAISIAINKVSGGGKEEVKEDLE